MALSTRTSSRPVMGATRARQGRAGRHIFWVLLFSTLLAALGIFAAWTWKSGDLASANADNGRAKPAARLFNSPEPAPVVPQPYQNGTAPESNHTRPDPAR
jgi:hypothetical protein